MALHIKRENSSVENLGGDAKRHELDASNTKVGRKPLQSEPKDKRTAQNRALQRLYRERKEKRMKELEDKVADLEGEKLELHNESEFLRIQVMTLMNELKKFRDDGDVANLLPKHVGNLTSSSKPRDLSIDASSSSASISTSMTSAPSSGIDDSKNLFHFDYTGISQPVQQYSANISISDGDSPSSSSSRNPGLTLSSASTSPGGPNLNQPVNNSSLRRSSILGSVIEPSNDLFDEQLNEFCLKLSEACGSKSCPIPKNISTKGAETTLKSSTVFSPGSDLALDPLSPFASLVQSDKLQPNSLNTLNAPMEFSALWTESPFDPSILFDLNNPDLFLSSVSKEDMDDEDEDAQSENTLTSHLVTEESMYDPLGILMDPSNSTRTKPESLMDDVSFIGSNLLSPMSQNTSSGNDAILGVMNDNNVVPASTDDDDDENLVVPSTDGNLLKCSAIWDRITSHPRYTEIDIEGLCSELQQRLKCSERGAVVDSKDVSKLLDANYLIKDVSVSGHMT